MGIMRRWQRAMNSIQHAFICLRPRDREHAGIGLLDLLGFRAHAAGNDDLAVLGHGLADSGERFLLGTVQEPAGVDDDDVGAIMLAGEFVAFGPQAGDDPLGIHQRLGTPKRNKADFRRSGLLHRSNSAGLMTVS